jgi:hypothetical protein
MQGMVFPLHYSGINYPKGRLALDKSLQEGLEKSGGQIPSTKKSPSQKNSLSR